MSEHQPIDQLKEATKDILSEDSLNEIETAFNEAVATKVQLHVEKALMEQDELHANKLSELLGAVDGDHTKKLEKLVEAIDIDHGNKLQAIVARHRNVLTEEAKQFKEDLVGSISKYLELYLEQTFPADMLEEAVNNKKAIQFLGELRKVFAIDTAMSKKAIKDAVQDGKTRLDESATAIDKLEEQNTTLKSKLDRVSAAAILQDKSSGLDKEKRAYVTNLLKDKSAEFITENFDYTLNMFDKTEEQRLEEMKAEALKDSNATKVDSPVIVESNNKSSNPDDSSEPFFKAYMGELGKY